MGVLRVAETCNSNEALPARAKGRSLPARFLLGPLLACYAFLALTGCQRSQEPLPDLNRPVPKDWATKPSDTCTIRWSENTTSCRKGDRYCSDDGNAYYPAERVMACPVEQGELVVFPEPEKRQVLRTQTHFIEFSESRSGVFVPNHEQIALLKDEMAKDGHKIIVYFAHGFRNSASATSGDPGRFATLLAHMAVFASQRCDGPGENRFGRQCDEPLQVIGVFLGWPAQNFDETAVGLLDSASNISSFNQKKDDALRVGPPMLDLIEEITSLARESNKSRSVRSIAFGHSLGGRALLAGLQSPSAGAQGSRISEALADWSSTEAGTASNPDLSFKGADLFILANPATEAMHWIRLQEEEWAYRETLQRRWSGAGVPRAGGSLFHPAQLPRILAFQSQCFNDPDPGPQESADSRRVEEQLGGHTQPKFTELSATCDEATSVLFDFASNIDQGNSDKKGSSSPSISSIASEMDFDTGRVAMGHYIWVRTFKQGSSSNRQRFGLTHTLTSNSNLESGRVATSIKTLIEEPELQSCNILPASWLSTVRSRFGGNWDTRGTAIVRNAGDRVEEVQSRYGYYIRADLERETVYRRFLIDYINHRVSNVTSGKENENKSEVATYKANFISKSIVADRYTPFWNMALDPSIGTDHGGFYSRQLFCHFTQLWLDATPSRAGSETQATP